MARRDIEPPPQRGPRPDAGRLVGPRHQRLRRSGSRPGASGARDVGQAIVKDTNHLQAIEHRRRQHLGHLGRGKMHRADRQIGREGAGLGAGDDPLTLLWHAAFRPVDHPRPRPVGADYDGMGARILQDHRYAAVHIGDQQHPRGACADLGDASDQAAFVQRDLTLADAVVRPDREQHRLGIDAACIRHHARGDVGRRGVRNPVQISLEPLVLSIERQCNRLPAAQLFVFLAQPRILGSDVPQPGRIDDCVPHGPKRSGERGIDRRQRIGQRHARTLGQHRIGLAKQHQPEGGHDQHRQGQLRQCLACLDGNTDHANAGLLRPTTNTRSAVAYEALSCRGSRNELSPLFRDRIYICLIPN